MMMTHDTTKVRRDPKFKRDKSTSGKMGVMGAASIGRANNVNACNYL
jgi:hypothetical protein